MHVLHDWGMRPSELGYCDPEDDIVWMTAYTHTRGDMTAWENQEAELEAKRQEAKSRHR